VKRRLVPTPLRDEAARDPIAIHGHRVRTRFRLAVFLVHAAGLGVRLARLWVGGRLDDRALGVQLSDFFQRLGVLWMKVGQLLSIRGELLPQDTRDELARLQDRARGFAPAVAVAAVEEALGAPLDEHFSEFERMPFAAASISQVHRARLRREGVAVAVKVQRPDVARVFAADMRLIRRLVGWLRRLAVLDYVRWDDLLWELDHLVGEELDYRFEASNIRRMRKSLRRHGVYAPKVYTRHSTERVLTMELVEGVFLSDYLEVKRSNPEVAAAWLAENDVEPRRVAKKIFTSHLRQSLEDNLFHCDLHPGNIVLLRESRIAFIDFGSIGFAERDFLRRYTLYLQALAEGEFAKLVDIYFLFVVNLPPIDLSDLKELSIRAIQAWEIRRRAPALPYDERSLGSLADELIRIAGDNKIALDWTFLRVNRAWFTMDVSFRELYPEADMKRLTLRFLRRKERRALRSLAASPVPPLDWLQTALELPSALAEQTIYRGGVIRRLAMVFEGSTSHVDRLLGGVFGGLAFAMLAVGSVLGLLFLRQEGVQWARAILDGALPASLTRFPVLDYQVWGLIFIVLAYACLTLVSVRRKFQREAVRIAGA
jgi:ubiquinone biosynthesis protein